VQLLTIIIDVPYYTSTTTTTTTTISTSTTTLWTWVSQFFLRSSSSTCSKRKPLDSHGLGFMNRCIPTISVKAMNWTKSTNPNQCPAVILFLSTTGLLTQWHYIVLFCSRPRSKGWPHHECTFSIYLGPLSFWLTLPQGVMSMYWCCPSRPCVVFLACVHLLLLLALSLSPGNCLVSSWCDHSMLASLLWQLLTVPSLLQIC